MPSNEEKKPVQITYACYLIGSNFFLGAILRNKDYSSLTEITESLFISSFLIALAINAFLIFGVSKGKSYARFLLLGMLLLRLGLAKLSFTYYVSVSGIAELMQIGMMILAIYLVYSAPGNTWFFSRKQATEVVITKR